MANKNEELLSTIGTAIKEVLNNDELEIKAESRFVQDLGLESIDFLDVSCELENAIGREVDFKDVSEFVNKNANNPNAAKELSVANVIAYLEANPA
ncbi:acyl carrier protein [bacterium]|nr:acyl carrier protein [bacterium]